MTVREFVQKILLEAPDLDATVYISEPINEIENKEYEVTKIDSFGSNDGVCIILKQSY